MNDGENLVDSRVSKLSLMQLDCQSKNILLVDLLKDHDADTLVSFNSVYLSGKRSLLHLFAPHNDVDYWPLFEKGQKPIDTNIKDSNGCTPLHYACQRSNIKVIKLLLKHGADPNIVSRYGYTPLMYLCKSGEGNKLKGFNILTKYGANSSLEHGEAKKRQSTILTLLSFHYGRHEKDSEFSTLLSELLNAGYDTNCTNRMGENSLHLACSHDDIKTVDALIEKGCNYALQDKNGKQPIERMINSVIKRDLFKRITRMDIDKFQSGGIPFYEKPVLMRFHYMIENESYEGNPEAERLLPVLLKEVPPDLLFEWHSLGKPKTTLLHVFATYRIVDYDLLFQGAEVNCNVIDEYDRGPLHLACDHGSPDKVRILLKHGADPNLRNSLGDTPLTSLSRSCDKTEILKILLEYGVDVNLAPFAFTHPIERLFRGHGRSWRFTDQYEEDFVQFIRGLVDAGSNINYISAGGRNALHEVCATSFSKIVKLLIQYGCDPFLKDKWGTSPIDTIDDKQEKETLLEWIDTTKCR